MRPKLLIAVLTLAAAAAPATALPTWSTVVAGAGHIAEVWQKDGSPTEVRLGTYHVDGISDGTSWSEQEGCVELFHPNMLEYGCGLELSSTASLAGAEITGVVETEVYHYIPETVDFVFVGYGQIEVDLTLTGDGAPRLAEPEGTGIGVCGLPPDIPTGGSVQAFTPVERAATIEGRLVSQTIGGIDIESLESVITVVPFAVAGACL